MSPLTKPDPFAHHAFATDGGIETTLMFHEGFKLPDMAAFVLMDRQEGRDTLRRYFRTYLDLAQRHEVGFVLESVTWRANPDWGQRLGYSPADLRRLNSQSIAFLRELVREYAGGGQPMVISGNIGPRGDGYRPDVRMTAEQAAGYHRTQVETFRDAGAEVVTAMTLPYATEAAGIVQAAGEANLPVVISFTVETDGRLPSGESLREAIECVDQATDQPPLHYMINCAHPTHFAPVLDGEPWTDRIRGIRANASSLSHAELDACDELDIGQPELLASEYLLLRERLRHLRVVGGCCGTDDRHLAAICRRLYPVEAETTVGT